MGEITETILTVARENRALRWGVIILSAATAVMAGALAWRPPPPVWVVSENGEIHQGDKQVVRWEPEETTRRALEILFIPTENRENLVKAFYDENLQPSVLTSKPRDRFISFQLKEVKEEKPGFVTVEGVLLRVDRPTVELTVILEKRPRSEINPFGLVVRKTTLGAGAE